jgi:UDP-3-O-[3-hydroxymyristoyl] glucosamine N-acyltransferase
MNRPRDVFVHPRALCESESVGVGTRIWAFAHVMHGARVGAGCNICDHAFIEAGAIVGDRVTVKNAVLIWDKVSSRTRSLSARTQCSPTTVSRGVVRARTVRCS